MTTPKLNENYYNGCKKYELTKCLLFAAISVKSCCSCSGIAYRSHIHVAIFTLIPT